MIRFLTVKKASVECGVPEHLIRTWIVEGKCPGIYSGTRFYVNVDKFEEMIRNGTSEK